MANYVIPPAVKRILISEMLKGKNMSFLEPMIFKRSSL